MGQSFNPRIRGNPDPGVRPGIVDHALALVCGPRLEGDAGGELHLAHVSGGGGVAEGADVGGLGEVEGGVDGVDVGVIEDVEGLGAELESYPFGDGEGLEDGGGEGDFLGAAEDAGL